MVLPGMRSRSLPLSPPWRGNRGRAETLSRLEVRAEGAEGPAFSRRASHIRLAPATAREKVLRERAQRVFDAAVERRVRENHLSHRGHRHARVHSEREE